MTREYVSRGAEGEHIRAKNRRRSRVSKRETLKTPVSKRSPRTGSTQLRQRLITQRTPRFHVVIHYAPRQLSADAYTRDCIRGERARRYTRGTVDINNTLADVEAVDMSSENPLTVTLFVSSLNLNHSRSYGRRVRRMFAVTFFF